MKNCIALAFSLFTVTLSASPEPLRIGHVNSMSGPEASFGTGAQKGIAMAIAEANAAGGIAGRPLELVALDDEGKSDVAVTAMTKLLTQTKAIAILSDSASSRTLAMAPLAQQAKVPLVSSTATSPKVTEVGDYIFRVCFIDTFQGPVMARFAREKLGAKKIAVFRDIRNDYSLGLATYFVEEFRRSGGTIVSDERYSAGDIDFRSQLTAIRAKKPDAVFIPGYYTDVGLIVRQARELGITQPLLGGDGWESPRFLQMAGAAAEGSYFANHYSSGDGNPLVHTFIAQFRKRYGEEPNSSSALGYDAARVIIDALRRSPLPTTTALRDALAATKAFPGVTGAITINSRRNADKPAIIVKVASGQFRYETTMTP